MFATLTFFEYLLATIIGNLLGGTLGVLVAIYLMEGWDGVKSFLAFVFKRN